VEEKLEEIQAFQKAGEILKSVRDTIISEIKPGMSLLQIAEKIESMIKEKGGSPAFPVNICVGNVAAHFTPLSEEDGVIPEDKVIKLDFGVHINGYSVDSARTLYFGDDPLKKEMIEVVNSALDLAISKIKPGVKLSEIGAAIDDYVRERGFKTISNLNGHKIEQWILHGDKEVPTSKEVPAPGVIEENEVYAVEIFVTNGEGKARARDEYRIFSFPKELPKRISIHLRVARDILFYVHKQRKSLPFTIRWLKERFSDRDIKVGLAVLESTGFLLRYPVLEEKEGKIVVQAEDTVIVTKEGAKILTR